MSPRIEFGGLSLDDKDRATARFCTLLALGGMARDNLPSTLGGIADEMGIDASEREYFLRTMRASVRDLQALGWAERFGREILLTRLGADVLSVALAAAYEMPRIEEE